MCLDQGLNHGIENKVNKGMMKDNKNMRMKIKSITYKLMINLMIIILKKIIHKKNINKNDIYLINFIQIIKIFKYMIIILI